MTNALRLAAAALLGAVVLAPAPASAAAAHCEPSAAVCFFVDDAARVAYRVPTTTGSIGRIDRCDILGHGSRLELVGGCRDERSVEAAPAPTRADPVSVSSTPENLNATLR